MENSASQNPPAVTGGGNENNPVVFDASSGISDEEQREILDKINSLSVEKGIVPKTDLSIKKEARKRGVLFPLLVNFGALFLLAAGFIFLWFYHNQDDHDIRRGSAILGVTERMMIQEIRQETNRMLSEKEREISSIRALLAGAGNEYRMLQQSVETLTEEQQYRVEYLLGIQNEYQDTLLLLENERTQILEDARRREAFLRAQAEDRTAELSQRIEQSQEGMSAAMRELAMLSNEQERMAAVEAQLGGYYTMAERFIIAGNYIEASRVLERMKEFLYNPLFLASRSAEAKKTMHLTAVYSIESAIAKAVAFDESVRLGLDPVSFMQAEPEFTGITPEENAAIVEAAVSPLQQRISELEQANRDQQGIINALSSQDEGQSRLLAEYNNRINNLDSLNFNLQNQVANLQTWVSTQQQSLNERDNTIARLRSESAGQTLQINMINTELNNLRADNLDNTRTIAANQASISELLNQNAAAIRTNAELAQRNETLTAQNAELTRTYNDLVRRNTDLTQTYNELVQRNAVLTGNVDNLERQSREQIQVYNDLVRQNSELTQNFNALTGRNTELTANFNALTGRNTELTANYNDLNRRNTELTANFNDLTRRNTELTQTYNDLLQRNSELVQTYNDSLQQNREMIQANNDLAMQNSEMYQRIEELSNQLEEIRRVAQQFLNP